MTASPRDDDLLRLFAELPRHEAPAIPVEDLIRRVARHRIRAAGLWLASLAAAVAAILLAGAEPEPPENLRLRVVNVGDPIEPPPRDPPELNLP